MVVYLAEDHELPVVEVLGYIEGGSVRKVRSWLGSRR